MRELNEQLGALDNALTVAVALGSISPAVDMARDIGSQAASSGWPLSEVLERVGRLRSGVMLDLLQAAASGWADETETFLTSVGCGDPLTGLASAAHLHHRIAGLLRAAQRDGRPVDHELIVVDFAAGPSTVDDDLNALGCAEVLRSVFTGDEVFARLHPQRVGVLVHQGDRDSLSVALVQRLVTRTTTISRAETRTMMLPNDASQLNSWLALQTKCSLE